MLTVPIPFKSLQSLCSLLYYHKYSKMDTHSVIFIKKQFMIVFVLTMGEVFQLNT